MGFIVILASIILARFTWSLMSRRSTPRFEGTWRSESYRRKIASSSSDYKTRSEYAAMRGYL